MGTLGLLESLPGVASALPNAASPMRAQLDHERPKRTGNPRSQRP